eukprot:TRINITY_DN55077_c0_g1_i1.p1 TRINITY_DN55077_c0_g1~~TRINITY_DN55077_c0_g1_i1.p1  ORF type:complete len:244 (-),score=82.96 TRINITY_DN55077_c0_g1_i1:218-886(-)
MTTAHRPTWNAAVASGTNPSGNLFVCQSTKVANRDAANFTTIKYREISQGAPSERSSKREYREELERKEQKAREEREGIKKKAPAAAPALEDNPFPEDADDVLVSEKGSDEEENDDDDEDEDAEELMRELAKIKREREAEEAKQKAADEKQDARAKREEIMRGNPLVESDLSLKRKWDDDTVFKNQARTAPKQKQRYINDAVRSDFHKKFLNKYVWVDGHAH